MFEALTGKLTSVLQRLGSHDRLTEADIDLGADRPQLHDLRQQAGDEVVELVTSIVAYLLAKEAGGDSDERFSCHGFTPSSHLPPGTRLTVP